MNRLRSRSLSRRTEDAPVDPMSSIGNLADAMLVLAVGISGVRNTRGKTWASCADKSWYTGKQKSYTITTAEQLAGLAVLVNGGTDFSGVTLKLGADLSLERDGASGAQRSWTPIGTSINRAFRGTFDGQGHKITGLRACNEGSDSALFGCVSGASGVGGIVGVSYSGEDKIENCANFGAVTGVKSGTYGTGGLTGRLAGTLTKSANYGAVTSADRYTGGLAGYTTARNKTTITLCRNEGAVSSTNTDERAAAGLLVGYAQNLIWGGCAGAADAAAIGRSGSVKQTAVTGEAAAFTAAPRPDDVPPPPEKTARAETESLPLVENGRVTASGSYQIPWFSTGTITVGANLDVALYGGSESFENLTLDVGGGTKLTLQNVVITGDQTLLQLAGGNALTLTGENLLDGASDTPGSEHPTVTAGGDLTIGGKGSLRVSAQVNNAAVYVSPGSRLRQSGGTLSIRKTDKLGFAGGAFYAPGSATLKNCAVIAWGHSGSSAKVSAVYAGEKAIPAIREQSGVRWREALPFADVTADELWYDDAAFCYEKGWLKGTSDTAFSPDAPMTRAMFVTALYRAAGSPAVKADAPFTDLKADWYKNAVAWAAEAGVVQGTGRLTFSPDDALTLEQAAVLMQRCLKNKLTADEDASLPGSAGAVSAWARGGVQWAYNAGLLCEADLSAPAEAAGRVLLAQLLRRSAE